MTTCGLTASSMSSYSALLSGGDGVTVLVIASSKGGPGKTLVASLIAGSLAAEGLAVAAIDADPTAGLHRWATTTYEGPPFVCHAEADEERLAHLIGSMATSAALVVVDTAGFGNRAATVAMTSADAVLVPMLPGEGDVTEAERTVRLVGALAVAARRDIPARVVLNRQRDTTALSRHAAAEAGSLPRLKTTLSDLVAFGEVSFSGKVPSGGKAGAETFALIRELRELGWLPDALVSSVKTA
jgi:chromosome partitioning protein